MSSLPINRNAVAADLVAALKAHENAKEALTKTELTTSDVAWAKSCLEREIELLDAIFRKTMDAPASTKKREVAQSIVWDGDNIAEVIGVMHPVDPVHVGRQFTDADELVGVPTTNGLRVARKGQRIVQYDDGALDVLDEEDTTWLG